MADVTDPRHVDEAQKLILADSAAQLPEPLRGLSNVGKENYLYKGYTRFGAFMCDHYGRGYTPSIECYREIKKLEIEKDRYRTKRAELKRVVTEGLSQCTTVEQFKKQFPELARYANVEEPIPVNTDYSGCLDILNSKT
jgi:hypothetical protein